MICDVENVLTRLWPVLLLSIRATHASAGLALAITSVLSTMSSLPALAQQIVRNCFA